jgi:hypothetical protein
MYTTCDTYRRDDGDYDIFKDAVLHHQSVPDSWLERQLVPHGIIEDTYREVRQKLAETWQSQRQSPAAWQILANCAALATP